MVVFLLNGCFAPGPGARHSASLDKARAARPVDGEAAPAPGGHQLVHVQQGLQRRGRPGHLVALLQRAKVVRERVPLHLRRPGALGPRLQAKVAGTPSCSCLFATLSPGSGSERLGTAAVFQLCFACAGDSSPAHITGRCVDG